MPADRRVVITGMGVVTSIGAGKDEFWKNLIAGKSNIGKIERFDTSAFEITRGGEIKDFSPEKFMPKAFVEKIGRGSQLAIAAAKMAVDDSGLADDKKTSEDAGVVLGSTMGEIPSMELIDRFWTEGGEEDVFTSNIMKFPVNNLSSNVAHFFGMRGNNYIISTACSSGNYAIGFAHDLIKSGKLRVILAGASDPFSRLALTGFSRLFTMAPERCQPFDRNRRGLMVGEGSAVLVIESLENAQKRNARIHAEILGYGQSCDAFNMSIPSEKGITKVMERAIARSGIKKSDVSYISAHGTGTALNDRTESASIKNVFGKAAKSIPVSSIKSMLGHTMGTASALEAVACVMALQNDVIPPTINFETPDPECDIDCVPNRMRRAKVNIALNNSFAFGGNNACLVLKKYVS